MTLAVAASSEAPKKRVDVVFMNLHFSLETHSSTLSVGVAARVSTIPCTMVRSLIVDLRTPVPFPFPEKTLDAGSFIGYESSSKPSCFIHRNHMLGALGPT